MSIFVIADLHLSFKNPKPMNIFGDNWENHELKIQEDWKNKVKQNDLVILPGDFSWAMNLEDAYLDFKFLNELPGKKLMLKGNHDYWWTTLNKMRKFLEDNNFNNIDFIHNNSYCYENYIIAGTRGWTLTNSDTSKKILKRELIRLELSLQEGIANYGKDKEILVFMHYPPISSKFLESEAEMQFIELMNKYNVKTCMYGHLHSRSHKDAVEGKIKGIDFKLVSADYLDFKLVKI